MKVTVDVPDRVWGRLALMADARQVKVAVLLEEAITSVAQPPHRTRKRPLYDPARRLMARGFHELGWSALETAERMHVKPDTILATWHDMGLRPRRQRTS